MIDSCLSRLCFLVSSWELRPVLPSESCPDRWSTPPCQSSMPFANRHVVLAPFPLCHRSTPYLTSGTRCTRCCSLSPPTLTLESATSVSELREGWWWRTLRHGDDLMKQETSLYRWVCYLNYATVQMGLLPVLPISISYKSEKSTKPLDWRSLNQQLTDYSNLDIKISVVNEVPDQSPNGSSDHHSKLSVTSKFWFRAN